MVAGGLPFATGQLPLEAPTPTGGFATVSGDPIITWFINFPPGSIAQGGKDPSRWRVHTPDPFTYTPDTALVSPLETNAEGEVFFQPASAGAGSIEYLGGDPAFVGTNGQPILPFVQPVTFTT